MNNSGLTLAEVKAIRTDFPILQEKIEGKPLVYLDSAATAQHPNSVIEAEAEFNRYHYAAVNRGAHTLAAEATELFEQSREKVAAFVGARANEVVWTSNATEGLNLISYSVGNASLGLGDKAAEKFKLAAGDEIVTTVTEHHANLIPWQQLAAKTGAVLRFIDIEPDGQLNLNQAAELITEKTKIVAVTQVSNVLGLINPIEELVTLAHQVGALFVLDACQSAPHLKLDLKSLDVDFAVFSGHKMLGPSGIGVFYGKAELLNDLPPFLTGGSMITRVDLDSAEFLPSPHRFEAGTQRVSQAIGLAAAIDYLELVGLDKIAAWEHKLGQQLSSGLANIDGIQVLGSLTAPRTGLASFTVEGVHSHDVGQFLDEKGIAVRVGHHCAQPLHKRLGLSSSSRASSYLYTTPDEIEQFLTAVAQVRNFFKA